MVIYDYDKTYTHKIPVENSNGYSDGEVTYEPTGELKGHIRTLSFSEVGAGRLAPRSTHRLYTSYSLLKVGDVVEGHGVSYTVLYNDKKENIFTNDVLHHVDLEVFE